ncbi:COPII coat assembly protein sec16 [Rhizoctonia solani]|uniref:COPII coat assembly protein sec16 n=1 Tax=Rhizoctonia solani TaxID=456999 RepID=A0A0K6FXS7_9AGAM|nr:COPII coat assembly protein sec16 [Rhizoctonia solani]
MPESAASPLSSPPSSRSHIVTDFNHFTVSHPHPRSHTLDHAPRTGSPLARRTESSGTRVQFADDPDNSRSSSIERASHPGRISDMPIGSLSSAIAARAASPSITSPQPQQQQQGLPPQRRLSSRRGSMAAVDPWGKHYNEETQPHSSTSRLTIVRVPSTAAVEEDPHGHSPSPGPYGGSRSFRERSHQRRSSWGANSGSDGEGEGRKRSRMSFAFSSFTPISPTPVSARQGPPQRTGSPGIGSGFVTSFGPAQSRARTRSIGSSGGVDLSSHNPTQDRSGARQPQLSAQQLYELAMASRDPAAPRNTSVQGVSAAVEPAHFTALPEGEILPFLDRPGEVEALINTPGTQSYKLFALLGILFPRPKEDESVKEEAKEANEGAPTPKAQVSQPMWPPFPGEERSDKPTEVVQPPSPTSVPPSKAAPAQHPLGLPSHPTQWTYAQLITHLTQTTREQLPDKEWVLFARACIRNRSEALWERVKGCLGVPNDIYEDEAVEDEDEEESPIGPVGISDLANLSPVARFKALRDNDSAAAGSDRAPSDDGHEPEAWIEPVFSGGPGSARGSVANSPTNYFTGATGLGGGRGDSKSWAGSVSGRSDGGRMEQIGEEEEEEGGEDDKDDNSTGADKTPEPDSPVVGLRIMTAPMSPGFHPAHTPASNAAGSPSPAPMTGETTPGGIPILAAGTGSGTASPAPASPSPSIHQFLGPPLPKARGGAWISPLSNTISTGGKGLSGMGGRSGAGWNSPTSGSGWNSPVSGGGAGGWNSPLSRGNRGSRGAWDPATERGPGNPIFPSSFARLSLKPTLSANNPNYRNPAPESQYPPFRYLRERYKWARPGSENDFAVTIASESSDAGGRF